MFLFFVLIAHGNVQIAKVIFLVNRAPDPEREDKVKENCPDAYLAHNVTGLCHAKLCIDDTADDRAHDMCKLQHSIKHES